MGIDRTQPPNGSSTSAAVLTLVARRKNGPGHALKVETRVQIPLGLRSQTCRTRAKFETASATNRRVQFPTDPVNIPWQIRTRRLRRRAGDAGPCLSLGVMSRYLPEHAVTEPSLHLLEVETVGGPRPPASYRRETAKALTSADAQATIKRWIGSRQPSQRWVCVGYIDS